jgi:integrase
LKLEERIRLFHLAAQKPEWETAYLAAVLAVNTTARKCELRALQWRHVDFINNTLEIPRSKTEAGVRVVPLNAESYEALWRLRRRAESFGQVELSHFVFAAFRPKFRFHGKYRVGMDWSEFDPTQPVGSWRTAWRTLTRAIQCNECGHLQKPGKTCRNMECRAGIQKIKNPLAGLRFHDLRHTSISALGEAGVPDRVIMDIAGHVSPRMLRRYSHTQVESKRAAIQSLSNRPKIAASEQANVTKHVTKEGDCEVVPMQVVEKNGRPVRTRTADLYRVKVAL